MKVVLVRPPFYALFGVTTPKMKTYPLNLLYLATYVRDRSSHQVAVVDGENCLVPNLVPSSRPEDDPELIMHRGIPSMVKILGDPEHELWQKIEREILDHKPNIVGITCNSGNMDTARLMVCRLKKHGVPVILGGSHPTVLPEQSLRYTGADIVAVGEGEMTLVQVLDSFFGGSNLTTVPSIAWNEQGAIRINPRGALIKDIDLLPIPDRSFVNRSHYYGDVVMTGRGCPFDCSYCASRNIWGKHVRLRAVSAIIEELCLLREHAETHDQYPGRWIVKIVDDTFTVNKKRTKRLLEEIIARGLNCFEFTGGVRADTLDEELVATMREANFRRVTLGVESGSPRVLELIRKGQTNADVKKALTLLRQEGIRSHTFFMVGLPEETLKDIQLSKQLILEAQPDYVEVNMVSPYPGTELFEKLMPNGPSKIDRWYRWFHQGMATHSDRLSYNLDEVYADFVEFARQYNVSE